MQALSPYRHDLDMCLVCKQLHVVLCRLKLAVKGYSLDREIFHSASVTLTSVQNNDIPLGHGLFIMFKLMVNNYDMDTNFGRL